MGGSASNEFMVKTDAGEDMIATCANCGYAANLEKATSRLDEVRDGPGLDFPSEFPTPGVRTIDDLANFAGGAAAESQIKTLVYVRLWNEDLLSRVTARRSSTPRDKTD